LPCCFCPMDHEWCRSRFASADAPLEKNKAQEKTSPASAGFSFLRK
jgi:hypothetical protein